MKEWDSREQIAEAMDDIAGRVHERIPEGHGFIIFVVPPGENREIEVIFCGLKSEEILALLANFLRQEVGKRKGQS